MIQLSLSSGPTLLHVLVVPLPYTFLKLTDFCSISLHVKRKCNHLKQICWSRVCLKHEGQWHFLSTWIKNHCIRDSAFCVAYFGPYLQIQQV